MFQGMKDFEVVHLAYPNTDSNNSSYISILFWQGIASFGYIDILTIGSIVACNNLEWRRATSWNVPVAYCTDRSTFTRNPRRNHLYESFESLRNLITVCYTFYFFFLFLSMYLCNLLFLFLIFIFLLINKSLHNY